MNNFDVLIWRILGAVVAIGLIVLLVLGSFVGCSPVGRGAYNANQYMVQKVDDATSYKTKKKVEDTCRSMIASYEADCLTYDQYKDSESDEKQGWAEQAKMRANRTASTYNNFILENNYVWSGNVPKDIDEKLDYLE